MNRRIIRLVIFLLILSLSGIIVLQFLWIRQAMMERSAEFDNNVNKALNQVVSHMDKMDDLYFLNQYSEEDPMTFISDQNENIITISGDHDEDSEIIISNDNGVKRLRIFTNDLFNQKGILDSLAQNLEFTGHDIHIDLTMDSLADDVERFISIKTERIIDSVMVDLEGKLRMFEEKAQSIEETYNQVVMEVKIKDSNHDPRIDKEQIEQQLEQAFTNFNIDLDFEYSIENNAEDRENEIIQSDSYVPAKEDYVIQLFPEDLYLDPYHLSVQFLDKDTHIYKSIGWLLFSSLIFTLVIIFTFGYTIVVILRQKKLSEIKSDFINNMTHEFKTPIATISLAVDSITNPKVINVPEKIKYFSSIIKKENLRMNNQVENILQMALIDRSELNLNLSDQDIHDMITKAVEHIQLQIQKRKGTISCQLDAAFHYCQVDSIHMTNVIYNLLDNANKYSSESPDISIHTTNIHKQLKISVRDKGIGIQKEELNKIFDKLYRISTGDIHNIKGFGLGLTYVKAIVLAHAGDIQVESSPSQGTVFHILLPLNSEHKTLNPNP
ncbi:MAG: hypothetical protein JEZ03_05420 [Bacteroidales bacterium]|nr:hypothetical protein [Bacteroidales bacterium]